VAIDLANSPSFEDKAVLEFFETSGQLLAAEAAAGPRRDRPTCNADRAPPGVARPSSLRLRG